MKINVRFLDTRNLIATRFGETSQSFNVQFGETQHITELENDYENLQNKPRINSVELIGEISAEDLGLGRVYYDTSYNWNLQSDIIGIAGAVYVYSDYDYIEDDAGNRTYIAGIKIGDGNSYLIDIPFVTDLTTSMIFEHISNSNIHVTDQEKAFWNNKVSSFIDAIDTEMLVLSKTHYESNGEII